MVCHGNDMKTLLNNLASFGFDKQMVRLTKGSISTLKVLLNDEHFVVLHQEEDPCRGDSRAKSLRRGLEECPYTEYFEQFLPKNSY